MDWLKSYKCVLLDFDGLLVDTEKVHFLAYKEMLKNRGYNLDWDFERYREAAHHHAEGLQNDIVAKFPNLAQFEWNVLYQEKKKALVELYKQGKVQLLPGAEEFLKLLEKANIKRAVVTHSDSELVGLIKKNIKALRSIPVWITRGDYKNPKPSGDGYLKALEVLGEKAEDAIGFEDSPRGLKALQEALVKGIFVTEYDYPEVGPEVWKAKNFYNLINNII